MLTEMIIENTSLCNFNCIYCGYSKRKETKTMRFDLFVKAVEQSIECGIKQIKLCPMVGEVFTDNDITRKILYLENHPHVESFIIYTNLSLITYDQFQILFGLKTKHTLRISLYGHDLDSFLFFTRSHMSHYYKILKNLTILANKKDYRNLSISIRSPHRYKQFSKHELFKYVYSVVQFNDDLYFQDDIVDTHMNRADEKLLKEFGLNFHEPVVDKCNVMKTKNIILWDGNFNLCGCRDIEQRSNVGNINDTKLIDLINSIKYIQLQKNKSYVCKDCIGVK